MYLIFDTETTGIPHNKTAPITDLDNWPRLVQIAWQLHDNRGKLLARHNYIVRPDGFDIPYNAQQIHGISTKRALEEGMPVREVMDTLLSDVRRAQLLVGHNIEFDKNIIGAELIRLDLDPQHVLQVEALDTGVVSTTFCQLSGGIGGKLKMPRLTELHEKLFGEAFSDAHDACYDVEATARCFFGLMHAGVVVPSDGTPLEEIVYEKPDLDEANFARREAVAARVPHSAQAVGDLSQKTFCHLHTHSQFSVLQATPDIKAMVSKAKELNMKALALTDIGNMYGAFKFVREALNQE
ncbi:MAG TPA: PHP domain-containing protein, partial [Cyclobacteriaceae bacterium]